MRAHRLSQRHRRRYPPSVGHSHSAVWRRCARGLASDGATRDQDKDQLALLIAWVHDANRLTGRARAGDQEIAKVGAWGILEGLEVSIYVDPDLRRQGIGSQMLAALPSACAERWPRAPFIAKISPGNMASRRLFERAGYRLIEERSSVVVLRFVRKDLHRDPGNVWKRYRRSRRLRLIHGCGCGASYYAPTL